MKLKGLNLYSIFKLPNLSKYNKEFLDVTIGKLTKSYDFKPKDLNGIKMKNLFVKPLEIMKSKLERRLESLSSLNPANKYIKLSANQNSFIKDCKRWLEKAIHTDIIVADESFTKEFKLTESGDIYKGEK